MKIRCEVCDEDEASLYCVADEAALCAACDHGVHCANKLAGKHQRFSIHYPSSKQPPLCDICQERRAFLFCHQDRAILCRECDIPIHEANERTQKHTRFLLTGVKLSPLQNKESTAIQSIGPETTATASSMSEYLIETLPGWHVEDFLHSSFLSHPHPHAYRKHCCITPHSLPSN